MTQAALDALANIFGGPYLFGFLPQTLAFLQIGALLGLLLGAAPGIGGVAGLAMMLPFTFTMDPQAAICLAIGMLSTNNTGDTVPAILFAIPGSNAAQATILDGYPMAKRGEAGRALGASYTASALGGVFGAVVLALSVPLLQPVVLAFGSPEFFMLALLGLSMVAVLSGRRPVRGLVVAFFGLFLGIIGSDPQTGVYRYAFGEPYLFEGLPLIPLALGLFALPEMIDLCIKGEAIASIPKGSVLTGVAKGVRDAFKHWFLVIRCGIIGALAGVVPGLGGAVVSWLAYGQALQTERGARESFGKGDVRGVIAPESANNSQEGGNLIPTLAFGIPASASMALVLSIMLIHGIVPGPPMLTTNLSTTYTMIWALVIGNISGTLVCLLLGRHIARLTTLPIRPLAGAVIALIFLSAMVGGTRQTGDLLVLVALAGLGWTMKRLGWARPPLLLGFILGPIIDRYFFISVERYGFAWLLHPIVLAIAGLIAVTVFAGIRAGNRPLVERVQSRAERLRA